MSGYAWVAAGSQANIAAPSPCNAQGCFKEARGQLCVRGTMPALRCTGHGTPQYSCNWETNWGAMIGMNANLAGRAWGAGAPAAVAVTFAGQPAAYRLMAHVSGEPESEIHCLEGYQSGQVVAAQQLRTKCWTDGGTPLPGFQNVDKIGLQILAAEAPVAFDVCISDVAVR